MNAQASQSSSSALVEVSWSPPSGGPDTITGYRIFYGSGDNASVPSVFTAVSLNLNEDVVGKSISIRSEADGLTSELITVTITSKTRTHYKVFVF